MGSKSLSSNGLRKDVSTTGKVALPQGIKREAELLYIHDIANLITLKVSQHLI